MSYGAHMIATLLLIFIVLFVFLAFYIPIWRNRWIRNKPFPEQWDAILVSNLPIYSALNTDEKTRLQQLIHLFTTKKRFVGCAGLEITDEIKVTKPVYYYYIIRKLRYTQSSFLFWYTPLPLKLSESNGVTMARCLWHPITFPENLGVTAR